MHEFVVVGSGGLGRHWVRLFSREHTRQIATGPIRRPLVVSGSNHPASRAQVERALAMGVPAVSAPARDHAVPEEVCDELTRNASAQIHEKRPDALIVFGGDTAYSLLHRIGISELLAAGEVLPGVPCSSISTEDFATLLVTKAGGFGDLDIVEQVLSKLQ